MSHFSAIPNSSMPNNPLTRLCTALSIGAPAVALLLWRKPVDQIEKAFHGLLQLDREALLRPDRSSIDEILLKAKAEHQIDGIGSWRNSLDTRRNYYLYSRTARNTDSAEPPAPSVEEPQGAVNTCTYTHINTRQDDIELLELPSTKIDQSRNDTPMEKPRIPLRVSSLNYMKSALDHGQAPAVSKAPSLRGAIPSRYYSNTPVTKLAIYGIAQTNSLPLPSTMPEGTTFKVIRRKATSTARNMLEENIDRDFTIRPETFVDSILGNLNTPNLIPGSSGDAQTDFEVPADSVDATETHKEEPVVVSEHTTAPTKVDAFTVAKINRLYQLKSPLYRIRLLFQDSGYEEGAIDTDDEIEAMSEDNESELNLILPPKNTSKALNMSPNKVDNLSIKFASIAIRHLDLGHEYLVEIMNEELDAQRDNRAQAQNDKLSVNISDILTRVCLSDTHVAGTPVIVFSQEFQLPAAGIENEDVIMLNLPDNDKGYALRTECGNDGRMSYYLDILMPLIENDGQDNSVTIVSQVDITSAVEQLAMEEYYVQRTSFQSAKSFDVEPDDWIHHADIESNQEQDIVPHKENQLKPPSRHMRRFLAFVQALRNEHLECCVFAGKKEPGWDLINWKVQQITSLLHEPGKQPVYEKGVDEDVWESIMHHMDESEVGIRWPQQISWGETKEPRIGYFVPLTDGRGIDDERRTKWWLMVLTDFDEDLWRTQRFV